MRTKHWQKRVLNRPTAYLGLMKYGTIADLCKYVKSSKKIKKASAAVISGHVKEYEKCDQNFIRSLSLLYAGVMNGKVKYQQSRSALIMKNTGKLTKNGSISKKKLSLIWVSQFPNPFCYAALVTSLFSEGHLVP